MTETSPLSIAAGGTPDEERDGPIVVAVVSWNTRELLARCLDALRADADAGRAQVWVVDNDSHDGSPQLVRERYGWVELIESGGNLGFGRAVNLVARRTRGAWLVAANADVAVAPGALARLRDQAASDPRVGLVGPRLVLLDGSVQPAVQPFPGLDTTLLLALHAGRFSARAARRLRQPPFREPAAGESVPWLAGAFVLMRRRAFEQVGGFDEDQWLYGEDMDLCWRLRQHGWQIRYEARAEAEHAHSAASSQRFADRALARHMATMNYLWMLRRRGAVTTRASALVATLDALARVAVLSLARLRDDAVDQRRSVAIADLQAHLQGLAPRARLARRARAAELGRT